MERQHYKKSTNGQSQCQREQNNNQQEERYEQTEQDQRHEEPTKLSKSEDNFTAQAYPLKRKSDHPTRKMIKSDDQSTSQTSAPAKEKTSPKYRSPSTSASALATSPELESTSTIAPENRTINEVSKEEKEANDLEEQFNVVFKELADCIPSLKSKPVSRMEVLKRATQEIKYLKRQNTTLETEVNCFKFKVQNTKDSLINMFERTKEVINDLDRTVNRRQ